MGSIATDQKVADLETRVRDLENKVQRLTDQVQTLLRERQEPIGAPATRRRL